MPNNPKIRIKVHNLYHCHSSLFGRQRFVGFYMDWTIEIFTCFAYFAILTSSTSLIIGFCLYINGTVADLRIQTARLSSLSGEHLQIGGFIKEVRFYGDVIRWGRSTCSNIPEFNLPKLFADRLASAAQQILGAISFYQLVTCAIDLALSLFALDHNGIFSVDAIVALYIMVSAVTPTFIFCYLAECITSDLLCVGDIFYESAWYRLPAKQQTFAILLMQCSQRRFKLNGFGIVNCSMRVFLSVRWLLLV